MAGLLGASLAVWATLGLKWSRNLRRSTVFFFLAIVFAGAVLASGWLPPYRPNNVLDAAGIGPFTLGQGMALGEPAVIRDKVLFWQIAGALSGVGMAFLAILVSKTVLEVWHQPPVKRGLLVFMAACVLGYLLPFAVTDYFDRYLLFVMPFLLAWAGLLLGTEEGHHRWVTASLLVVGLLGAVALHDYFGWNRARWQAISYAESHYGAGPANMDAGFEYNGFYNYESRKKLERVPRKNWWWVMDDEFLVAFSPSTGFVAVKTIPVERWLGTTPAYVYLLKRQW